MTECCSNLFTDFTFQDLKSAEPPAKKGVYVIKVSGRGEVSPEFMIVQTEKLISRIGWNLVTKFIINRVKRLDKIGSCPIIYMGSAGGRRRSKNTLKDRYEEFPNRHTAMYPLWVLLYFGWELELGWKTCLNPLQEEDELKRKYRDMHNELPALVGR
jgi:hypothetical protein